MRMRGVRMRGMRRRCGVGREEEEGGRGGRGEKKEKQKDVALRPPEAVQTVVS